MKTTRTLTFVTAMLIFLSVNTYAQKSVAFLKEKTAKTQVDEKIVMITFQVNNIGDEKTKQKFQDAFKSYQGTIEVTSRLETGNMATYSVKVKKGSASQSLQQMFDKAGIETVNIDGNEIATKELLTYKKGQRGSNK